MSASSKQDATVLVLQMSWVAKILKEPKQQLVLAPPLYCGAWSVVFLQIPNWFTHPKKNRCRGMFIQAFSGWKASTTFFGELHCLRRVSGEDESLVATWNENVPTSREKVRKVVEFEGFIVSTKVFLPAHCSGLQKACKENGVEL